MQHVTLSSFQRALHGRLRARGAAISALLAIGVIGMTSPTLAETFIQSMPTVSTSLDNNPYEGDSTKELGAHLGSHLWDFDTSKLPGAGCGEVAGVDTVTGDLVDSWTVSPDGLVITAKVKNYTSQYGNKLTAEDVRWSFERSFKLKAQAFPLLLFNNASYRQPNPIDVVDEKTFTLTRTKVTAMDLAVFSWGLMTVFDSVEMKKHATAADPWAATWAKTNIANFGPWKLEAFDPGSQIVLSPNTGFGGKRGNIDQYVIKAIPDATTRMQLLQAGEIDWATVLSYDQYVALKKSGGDVVVLNCQSGFRDYLALQQTKPPFNNLKVRQAINAAIDRKAIIQVAYSGLATPTTMQLSTAYGVKPEPANQITYDPELAKKLLAEAGFPDGFAMTLSYNVSRPGPQAEAISLLLRDQLAKVGIKVRIDNIASVTDANTRRLDGNYESFLYSEAYVVTDPAFWASIYVSDLSAFNVGRFDRTILQPLNEPLLTTPPGPERDVLIQKLAASVKDNVNNIYIAELPHIFGTHKNITGFQSHPFGLLRAYQLTKK